MNFGVIATVITNNNETKTKVIVCTHASMFIALLSLKSYLQIASRLQNNFRLHYYKFVKEIVVSVKKKKGDT